MSSQVFYPKWFPLQYRLVTIVAAFFFFMIDNFFSIDPVALSELVKKQVEYYFSRENLQNDSFLMSQMDSQNSVPMSIVMQVIF